MPWASEMKGDGNRPVVPTSRAPVPTRTSAAPRATFDFGASKNGPAYKAARGGNSIGLLATVADALRRSGEPASAVAYLAQGKGKEALGSLQDIYREKEQVRTIGLSDIPFVKRQTDRLPTPLRIGTNFLLDVAGDPLTYVTFGTAGVARGASGKAVAKLGGKEAALLAGKRAAITAGRGTPESLPLLNDIAKAATLTKLEREGLDPAIQFGLRIPFSREKSVTLAGMNLGKSKRIVTSLGSKIPGGAAVARSTRKSFLPSRGASLGMREVDMATRRAAEVEARAWQKEYQALGRETFQLARREGVKPAKLHELIARHLDNPDVYDAPAFATELAGKWDDFFNRVGARELTDGVERGSVKSYVPHVILKDPDENLATQFINSVRAQETPSFTKERSARNFDELDRKGIKYETNLERLAEARVSASVRARRKLAVDKATFETYGVGRPLVSDEKAVGKLDTARQEWLTATDAYRTAEAAGVKGPELQSLKAAKQKADRRLVKSGRKVDDIAQANAKLQSLPVSRLASSAEWRSLEDGWQTIADSPRFADAVLPPDVARDLKAVHKSIADSMKDPVAPLKFLRATQGTWKRLALATPGFHIRNQFDDSLRAWWAGARNPMSYGQAARVLKGSNLTIKTKAGSYTGDELFDLARTHGVIDVGFVAQEAASSESRHRLRVEAFRHGRLRYANAIKGSENVGAFREDFNRLGLFIERLKAGDNPVQAAAQVRKYMFDYGDVGQFVTVARRYWMPFITYASKSIPLVAGEFARRPGRMSHIYAMQRTMNEEAGNPDLSLLSPEDALSFALPGGVSHVLGKALGIDASQMLMANPKGVMGYSMLNDLSAVRSWRDAERVGSSFLSPFVKAPIELTQGRSMYTGRDFPKSGVKANAMELLLAKATGGRGFNPDKEDAYTGQTVTGINPRLSYILRMLPQVNQISSVLTLAPGLRNSNPSANLPAARTLGGVPITTFDRAKQKWLIDQFGER